jgi:hypothetical protein
LEADDADVENDLKPLEQDLFSVLTRFCAFHQWKTRKNLQTCI